MRRSDEVSAFKKRRGINLPYEKQGDIYFTCLNFRDKPPWVQDKIHKLCDTYGGQYREELFEVVTTEKTIRKISMERHVSENELYLLRKRFYEAW